MMDFLALAGSRYSVRSFADTPVPEELLEKVLKAGRLAPTAMNRQSFYFERFGNVVSVEAGKGPFTKVDLGIVKCHFEIGAGKDNFQWMPEDM